MYAYAHVFCAHAYMYRPLIMVWVKPQEILLNNAILW